MCERTFPLSVTGSVPAGAARPGSSAASHELLGSPETSSGVAHGHALTPWSRSCSNRSLSSDRQRNGVIPAAKSGRLATFELPDAESGLHPGRQHSSGFTGGTFLFLKGNKTTHYKAVCLNLSSQTPPEGPRNLANPLLQCPGSREGADFTPGGRCWEPQDCRQRIQPRHRSARTERRQMLSTTTTNRSC